MASKTVLGGREAITVAIAQISPVYLDKAASTARAVDAIAEAAAGNADMIVFPETWLAGYPYWTEGWDSPLDTWVQTRIRFRDAAVMVGDESCHSLGEAAARHEIHVVMGVNELDDTVGSDTIYNSQFFFDRQGVLYGRRRKLMPTFIERVFWGRGTADDVRVFDTDVGRVGGLICGEHLMPLVRGAMVELGEEIHVASFPGAFALHAGPQLESPDPGQNFWGHSSVRNHAFEAGAFVLSACAYVDPDDIDDAFPHKASMNLSYATGGSSVISPLGVPLVEPSTGSGLRFAECPAWMIKAVKAIVDAGGHYSRPDAFRLQVLGVDGWQTMSQARIDTTSVRPGELERAADAYEVSIDTVREVAELHAAGRSQGQET